MAKPDQAAAEPSFQEVQYFLHLLDDVNVLQELLLEETLALRARVQELEGREDQDARKGRTA